MILDRFEQQEMEANFRRTLSSSLSPFEKFVAKPDIEESLPVAYGRIRFMDQLIRVLQANSPYRIIPIVSNAGVGKTFLLWEIKRSLKIEAPAVFAEVPADARSFFYNIYSKIIKEIGPSELREVTYAIANEWGADERKYGLFRIMNTQKVLENAMKSQYYLKSEHKSEMLQAIKGIIDHAMDPDKTPTAERWLFGEHMEIDDLLYLGIEDDLSAPYIAEEILKIIASHLKSGVILMFDDIDKTFEQYNTFSEDDDDDLTEPSSPVKDSRIGELPSFFSLLYTLGEQIKDIKIVITLQEENRDNFMKKFPRPSKIAIHPGLDIPNYTPQDTKHYYLTAIEAYMKKHNLTPILGKPYYPLTEELIDRVHMFAHGNPREIIRIFGKLFDAFVLEDNFEKAIDKILQTRP